MRTVQGQENLRRPFPTDKARTLPLNRDKQPCDQAASLVAAQITAVLYLGSSAIAARWCIHFDGFLARFLVELVTVLGTFTRQVFGLGFNYVELKTQPYQRNLMAVSRMGADRQQ